MQTSHQDQPGRERSGRQPRGGLYAVLVLSLCLPLAWGLGCGFFTPPVTPGACNADSATGADAPADLNSLLAGIIAIHKTPSLFGAIVIGDRVRALGAVGIRMAGSDVPVTSSDAVQLGSCTKAMTATLVGLLVDS